MAVRLVDRVSLSISTWVETMAGGVGSLVRRQESRAASWPRTREGQTETLPLFRTAALAEDAGYVVHVGRRLDNTSYEALIHYATELKAQGVRRLVLDLGEVEEFGLSGLYAICSIALLVRGRTPPDPQGGWNAVRYALTENRAAGVQTSLTLRNPPEPVARILHANSVGDFAPIE